MTETIDTVVIGGGQAGLAMSYHLRRLGREHVILERARVAERWRTQRWDSLRFQFPNWSIELPGLAYAGSEPDDFAPRDDVVRFLEGYAAWIEAPLSTSVNVLSLRASANSGHYDVVTDRGDLRARNVVIATGPYQRPRVPAIAPGFPAEVAQVHASEYRNPQALPPGAVLVVGSGASGCQIAEELIVAGRQVYFSVGRHSRVPRRYRGRDVFWWRRELGHLDRTTASTPKARRVPAPLVTGVGGGHDIDIRRYAGSGMTLLGHVRSAGGGRIALDPDLEQNLALGDSHFADFTREVDDYVQRSGIDAPPAEGEARATAASVPPQAVDELDLRAAAVGSVIWATGYSLDFGWVELPIFDRLGDPAHRRGVTAAPGVYLLGLAWLAKQKSSFLCGVGEDAEFLASHIPSRATGSPPPG